MCIRDSPQAVRQVCTGGVHHDPLYGLPPLGVQQLSLIHIWRVKNYKAGFVISDSNLRLGDTLADVLALKERTGHSTMAVTDDGTGTGRLLGLVTSRDYRVSRMDPSTPVSQFMTPAEKICLLYTSRCV